jgi:hypothetical protein
MSKRSRDEDRADRDAGLDETLAATFPASDPLSTDPDPAHTGDHARNAGPDESGASRTASAGADTDQNNRKEHRRR